MFLFILIIFLHHLKVGHRVAACRAVLKGFNAKVHIPAPAAYPVCFFILFKDPVFFKIVQKLPEAFFMMLLNGCNQFKRCGYLGKTFVAGCFSELRAKKMSRFDRPAAIMKVWSR